MSIDSVKNRSSSCSARRRSMNMPISLPTADSIESRSSSGSRISRLKNSSTLSTSPWRRMGNPNAACSPSRAAIGARGKFVSFVTSGIHAGWRDVQTRPGRPRPGANVQVRLAASNSGNDASGAVPDLGAAQHVRRVVDRPERAVIPAERLADRLEDPRRGLVDRRRGEQRACGDVLGGQPPIPGTRRGGGSLHDDGSIMARRQQPVLRS